MALQYLEPVCFDHEVYAEFSTFYLLLNFGEEESKNVRKNVRQMLDELKARKYLKWNECYHRNGKHGKHSGQYQEVFSGRCIYDKAEASFRNRADAGNG